MELNVINELGQEAGKAAASDAVFGREYNEALVHQLVVAYQANARQGTRAQLSREFVRHTTRKPWNQKGTGRAVRACPPRRCGVVVAVLSRTRLTKTSATR